MKTGIVVFLFSVTWLYITFYLYEYRKHSHKSSNYDYPFQDPTLPVDVRLDNLMSLLTREEKVRLSNIAPGYIVSVLFED